MMECWAQPYHGCDNHNTHVLLKHDLAWKARVRLTAVIVLCHALSDMLHQTAMCHPHEWRTCCNAAHVLTNVPDVLLLQPYGAVCEKPPAQIAPVTHSLCYLGPGQNEPASRPQKTPPSSA